MRKLFWIILALAVTASIAESPADDEEAVVENVEEIPTPESMPSGEQLLKMLENMKGLSDEEKAKYREELLKRMANARGMSDDEDEGTPTYVSSNNYQIFSLLGCISVIALILGFFAYKLYQNLVAREIRREMKKKQKEMKKKK